VITPFDEAGRVDECSLGRRAEEVLTAGAAGLVAEGGVQGSQTRSGCSPTAGWLGSALSLSWSSEGCALWSFAYLAVRNRRTSLFAHSVATSSADSSTNPGPKGLQKADLSWDGPSGTSFDVYRNGAKIATVGTIAYTDNINKTAPGTYTYTVYTVCAAGTAICSNAASVSF
jgi:hypothetical protein